MPDQKYLTLTEIKARGWTDAAVKKFLGEEDSTAKNSHNRNSRVRLYLKSRVQKAELTPEFKEWQEKSIKRRESAKKAAETRALREAQALELKAEQLKEFNNKISNSLLVIEPLSHKELIRAAVERWNALNPSPERVQIERSTLNAEIKRLPKASQQKFVALINNAKSVISRHFDRIENNKKQELTKSINDLFATIRSFVNFFNKEKKLAELIYDEIDLTQGEAIANQKQLEPMLDWLTQLVDDLENNVTVAVCSSPAVDLVTLAVEQIFIQHEPQLDKFKNCLLEIAKLYPTVDNRYEVASRRYYAELTRYYRALGEKFMKLHFASKEKWQQENQADLVAV